MSRLLEPGPLVPDEPHQRGDSHLLEGHNLGNISSHVLSGRLVPGDYLSKVPGLAVDWRRRGTGAAYDLAPLAQQAPLSSKPDFRPLPPAALEAAFTLEPGGFALTEAEKGDLQPTNLGGFFGAPLPPPAAPAAQSNLPGAPATAPAAGAAPTVIKLKLAAGGTKKRRRDGGDAAG